MDELVQRLSEGTHPVAVGGPVATLAELHRRVDELGFVFVKFTGTTGGTDLGVRLDRERCALDGADFAQGSGCVHLEGSLVLNDEPVLCVADIDLATLSGTGRLMATTGAGA
ncbi:hypothetical protein ACFORO_29390 [Amycolatopsis halotolerans]|uniref:MbtH domain protein n=1 Tax=Amycolatopsis halotolerans TaxID=330083 RepID=A0ABV7QQX2_9PSEU